jgi:hypothetical protein
MTFVKSMRVNCRTWLVGWFLDRRAMRAAAS